MQLRKGIGGGFEGLLRLIESLQVGLAGEQVQKPGNRVLMEHSCLPRLKFNVAGGECFDTTALILLI